MTGRTVTAALLAGVVLVLAGCGGSSSDSSAPATEAATTEAATTEAATTEAATTEAATTAEATTTDTTATDTGSSGSGSVIGAGADKQCRDLVSLAAKFTEALSAGAGGSSDAGLEKTAEAYSALASKAPEEIRGALKTFADVMANYAKAFSDLNLKAGDTPSASQLQELSKIGQRFNEADVQKASATLEAWSKKHCGTGG